VADRIVFCSSEEKRVWEQHQEGRGFERSTAFRCIYTLKAEPQERMTHETRRLTGYTGVTPEEVYKTFTGHVTGAWTPRVKLPVCPERCRGRNFTRAFDLSARVNRGFYPVKP